MGNDYDKLLSAAAPTAEQLVWREDWILEIDLLDDEHRTMVALINRVFDAADEAPLTERLDALIAHLRRHFHTEQVFLRSIDYPQTEEHCREHALQIAEFVDLRRTVSRRGLTELGHVDKESIRRWFLSHVIAQDRLFGAYYREVVCGR